MKLVSILIPVYNREKYIELTVNSALSQTYENIEVVVVDNNSTDNTWSILTRLKNKNPEKLKIFKNNTNIGPVNNWFKCLHLSSGKYCKFLWSDDLIHSNFIERSLPHFDNPGIGFVYSSVNLISETGNIIKTLYKESSSGEFSMDRFINGVLFYDFPVSPGCAIFRKTDISKNLILNIDNNLSLDFPNNAIGNDLLIFLLTAINYSKYFFISDSLCCFRSHKECITIKSKKDCKLNLYYNVTKSFFVENYRPDLIKLLNSYLKKDLYKYKSYKDYSVRYPSDFYFKNKSNKMCNKFFIKLYFLSILKKFFRYVQK